MTAPDAPPPVEIPESFTFGDGIDWSSPLEDVLLYVELPFWLMVSAGPVDVVWAGQPFHVDVCSQWMEVFVDEVTDSRLSCFHHGPWKPSYEPPPDVAEQLAAEGVGLMRRLCKTVLRLPARAHASAFRDLAETALPRERAEQEAYWASLCEAHLPVVNEVVQRYRLSTYDYFAFEVSPFDVPIWYLKRGDSGYRAVLLPYANWDTKPVVVSEDAEGNSIATPFEFVDLQTLSATSSTAATPGEFDLLDARSLMEHGDYTGAVRRSVTAIEAVLAGTLLREFESAMQPSAARKKLEKMTFRQRFNHWKGAANPPPSAALCKEFESTREMRHEIVHEGRRLTYEERGRAQRAVDTTRWLFNRIEANPSRETLREKHGGGVLRSVGRSALTVRFPPVLTNEGITLQPL